MFFTTPIYFGNHPQPHRLALPAQWTRAANVSFQMNLLNTAMHLSRHWPTDSAQAPDHSTIEIPSLQKPTISAKKTQSTDFGAAQIPWEPVGSHSRPRPPDAALHKNRWSEKFLMRSMIRNKSRMRYPALGSVKDEFGIPSPSNHIMGKESC